MYVFKDTAGVRESFEAQKDRAIQQANRIKRLIHEYDTRRCLRASDKTKIETEIRSEGGVTYLRERLYGLRHEVTTWEQAIEMIDGINPALWDATHPEEIHPTTCILTGEDGENPDDCTTHEHEEALKGLTCIDPKHAEDNPCVVADCKSCQEECDPKYWVKAGEPVSLAEALNEALASIQATIHKARPDQVLKTSCAVCGQTIKCVAGGSGKTWIHADSGAVVAKNPPGVKS